MKQTEREVALAKKQEVGNIMQHLGEAQTLIDKLLNSEACEEFLEEA